MDKRIAVLETPEECEQLALNVEKRLPDLALAARRRAVELRAALHNATTTAEREALEAVYAYERALFEIRGKKVRATRTWQMIDRLGIIPAVERIVCRKVDSSGYVTLIKMGMEDLAFEAVVLKHPDVFTADAVTRSRERLRELADVTKH